MAPDIATLTAQLQQVTSSLAPSNDRLREGLLQAARSLVRRLETPAERVLRMGYQESTMFGAIRVLIDLNVFKMLASSDSPKKATELAEASSADPQLMCRLLKHVATEGFVEETGPDEYAAGDLTRELASTNGSGYATNMFQICKVVDHLPAFLKETHYVNPTDNTHSPFQYAYQTDQHYFTFLNSPGQEEMFENFKRHMEYKTIGLKWFEHAPIMNELFAAEKFSDDDVIMIDIGGSSGADILGFKKAHNDLRGRLILQDLPAVINTLDSAAMAAKGVEAMSHDMLTPQPVQHAKAYFLKMVLHDWPVVECRQALANLKTAMKPGYSRILLNEIVIPDVKAEWFETSIDMLMLMTHAAQERREMEWKELVESVPGLKVKKFWDIPGALEKIIEIEVEQ